MAFGRYLRVRSEVFLERKVSGFAASLFLALRLRFPCQGDLTERFAEKPDEEFCRFCQGDLAFRRDSCCPSVATREPSAPSSLGFAEDVRDDRAEKSRREVLVVPPLCAMLAPPVIERLADALPVEKAGEMGDMNVADSEVTELCMELALADSLRKPSPPTPFITLVSFVPGSTERGGAGFGFFPEKIPRAYAQPPGVFAGASELFGEGEEYPLMTVVDGVKLLAQTQ